MAAVYWILCVLIGLIPAYFIYRKDKKRTFPLRWLPALLRFLTFFFTAALLLAPAFPGHRTIEETPIVLWLQDESASMKHALGQDSTTFRKKAETILQTKEKSLRIIPLSFGTQVNTKIPFRYKQNSTNMGKALQDAFRRYQNQNIAAVILASDGNYNQGSNPIYALPDKKTPIYTIGLGDSTRPRDLSVSFARANKTATIGNSFELMVGIRAEKLSGANATLEVKWHQQILAQKTFTINKGFYNQSFRFYLPANKKGLQEYTLSVKPLEGEQNIQNNHKSVFINVLEKDISIFIAASAPHPDIAAIKEALANNPEYKIQIKYGNEIPASVSGQDLLITHDLPDHNGLNIPAHGQIPAWNILGPHTNLNAFSSSQDLLTITPGNGFTNCQPKLNPSFSLFLLPDDIRNVMAQMPPLKTPIGKYELTRGQVLFYQESNTQGSSGPLWAIDAGQQPQSILCGTGIWRWRLYSFKNFKQAETIDALVRQNITLLTQGKNQQPFKVNLMKFQFQDREPIPFSATLQDAAGNLINTPDAKLVISDSAGNETIRAFHKSGRSYQLSLSNLPAGKYTFKASVPFNGKNLHDAGAFEVREIPLEQLKSYSDYALLFQLSQNTGGTFFTLRDMDYLPDTLKAHTPMKPILRQETHYYHWIDLKWLFFFILITAALEWLLRKYWGL